jgi:catechol 2,3-dioxygenase-like lactoylglutathione lyase family enzyme
MRFEIDQPPRARDRRVIGRRLVQPDAEKIAQRQRIRRAPRDAGLRVNPFEVADEQQAEIDAWRQVRRRDPHRRLPMGCTFAHCHGRSVERDSGRVDHSARAVSRPWYTFGKPAVETHMTKPEISGIAPLFIVNNVPAALAFYRDRLGFDITFQGPEPDDIFFGIVQRGAAMIMFKDVGVDPVPNYTRDVKKGIARWDAYLHVPDPDALAAEFSSRNVEFSEPLKDTDDGLRGFELKDADGYILFFGRPRS